MKYYGLIILLFSLCAKAQDKVKQTLHKMTQEEKLAYIGGEEPLYIKAIPRLGLPRIVMSDGPVGIDEYGNSTAYPAGIAAAATWDTTLIRRLGISLGRDAKARGVNILLAPGVNIYRAPVCGRNFEYFGEGPYLSSRMAVAYIKGVQSQGVAATVKHFAANNQEYDRHHVSSDMDERTLQEIYLPAFKAAVQEANVACVMDSYNLVNGVHATQNGHLNKDILKGDWGFKGILMSDWWATHDGMAAANNGLDLEMPSGKHMNEDSLRNLPEAVLDDKVRRILRIVYRFGFEKKQVVHIPKDDPAGDRMALQVALESTVLLKNEQAVLPLKEGTIAVIGPNANKYVAGGGSSYTTPFHAVSIKDGIKKYANVLYAPALFSFKDEVDASKYDDGIQSAYYKNANFTGEPVERKEVVLDHQWGDKPDIDGFPTGPFSVRYTAAITPVVSGRYFFSIRANGPYKLFIDNQLVTDKSLDLQANHHYQLRLEYSNTTGFASISFAWYNSKPDFVPAIEAAKKAEAAVICVGFNDDLEQEGFDRSFALPEYQDSLIEAIAKVNTKTIVIVNAGGNVAMPWLNEIKGLLHAWYPGQEGGTAIAEILFGKVNPSGKLPASFEKRWEDNPVHDSYYAQAGHVSYKEGLFVGYRYWDTAHIKPQFPFGFGLSYTKFSYSDLQVHGRKITFRIKNVGKRAGDEVAQVYVGQAHPKEQRPVKELKGFARVHLQQGESKWVTINLPPSAFAYYHTDLKRFATDQDQFTIMVGSSGADIKLRKQDFIRFEGVKTGKKTE